MSHVSPSLINLNTHSNKYLATGANECVGYMGPALGGGHGRLEGLYGLIADNILELNVVLADGSTIKVSEKSHKELFWAMRGAGHNFGIVTSAKVKIYRSLHPTWHWHNYIWSEDKLETVFSELNKIQDNGKAPVRLGSSYGSVGLNKSISATKVHPPLTHPLCQEACSN